jgi:thioredoxin reductase
MYQLIEAEAYRNNKVLVAGGGDSAVEAALGLASQKGNQVSLSNRRGSFSRIKERNGRRIEESIRSGKIRVLFSSNTVEIKEETVVVDCSGRLEEIRNDFVWIFAGGVPPNAFLERIGVRFGTQIVNHTESQSLGV